MSRAGPFGTPFCLGFDDIERVLERLSKSATDSFPPMNVEEPAEGCLRITLAVAGFAPEQLSVTLTGRELTVRGEKPQGTEGDLRVFLHKGIAARGFQRSFVVADDWEISEAQLSNGLLTIELKSVRGAPQIRQIPITSR